MKKMSIILGIIMFLVIAMFIFVISGAFSVFMPKPLEPEIKHGEFPIEVTCSINGVNHRTSDVIICDYAGVESLGTAGKYRKWNSYLKSGNKHLIIVSDRKDEKNFEITIDYGQAEYYMGDYELESKDDYEEKIMKSNYLGLYYFDEDGSVAESKTITYEQARNDFGIDAIDIQYSQPVSNKFE